MPFVLPASNTLPPRTLNYQAGPWNDLPGPLTPEELAQLNAGPHAENPAIFPNADWRNAFHVVLSEAERLGFCAPCSYGNFDHLGNPVSATAESGKLNSGNFWKMLGFHHADVRAELQDRCAYHGPRLNRRADPVFGPNGLVLGHHPMPGEQFGNYRRHPVTSGRRNACYDPNWKAIDDDLPNDVIVIAITPLGMTDDAFGPPDVQQHAHDNNNFRYFTDEGLVEDAYYVNDEFCRILCDRIVLCIFQMHIADPRILIRMCWCEEHPTIKSVVHPNRNARHFHFAILLHPAHALYERSIKRRFMFAACECHEPGLLDAYRRDRHLSTCIARKMEWTRIVNGNEIVRTFMRSEQWNHGCHGGRLLDLAPNVEGSVRSMFIYDVIKARASDVRPLAEFKTGAWDFWSPAEFIQLARQQGHAIAPNARNYRAVRTFHLIVRYRITDHTDYVRRVYASGVSASQRERDINLLHQGIYNRTSGFRAMVATYNAQRHAFDNVVRSTHLNAHVIARREPLLANGFENCQFNEPYETLAKVVDRLLVHSVNTDNVAAKRCTIVVAGPPHMGKTTFTDLVSLVIGKHLVCTVSPRSERDLFWASKMTESTRVLHVNNATLTWWRQNTTNLISWTDSTAEFNGRAFNSEVAIPAGCRALLVTTNDTRADEFFQGKKAAPLNNHDEAARLERQELGIQPRGVSFGGPDPNATHQEHDMRSRLAYFHVPTQSYEIFQFWQPLHNCVVTKTNGDELQYTHADNERIAYAMAARALARVGKAAQNVPDSDTLHAAVDGYANEEAHNNAHFAEQFNAAAAAMAGAGAAQAPANNQADDDDGDDEDGLPALAPHP